jgi:hypothetical protein
MGRGPSAGLCLVWLFARCVAAQEGKGRVYASRWQIAKALLLVVANREGPEPQGRNFAPFTAMSFDT